jgi:hypothetical protein
MVNDHIVDCYRWAELSPTSPRRRSKKTAK